MEELNVYSRTEEQMITENKSTHLKMMQNDSLPKGVRFFKNQMIRTTTYVETIQKKKNAVFWDVAPCRSRVNRRFGGTNRLHLQRRKIRERARRVSKWLQTAVTQDLYRATSQKTVFFIVRAVKTSNLTFRRWL
jgi:hypothetical protein